MYICVFVSACLCVCVCTHKGEEKWRMGNGEMVRMNETKRDAGKNAEWESEPIEVYRKERLDRKVERLGEEEKRNGII